MLTSSSFVSGGYFRGVQPLLLSGNAVSRYEMAGASVDRVNAIVAGGKDSVAGASPSSNVFKYSGDTQSLVNVAANLTTPRISHASFAAGNDLVVFCAGSSEFTPTLSSVEIYTVTTDILSAGNPMTTPRRRCTGLKSVKDTGIVLGGVDTYNNYTNALEEFNFVTKTFANSSLTHDRAYMSASQVAGGLVLVSGGEIASGLGDTTQKYFDLVALTAITVSGAPAYINRSRHVSFGMLDGSAFITSGIITTSPALTTISEYHIPKLAINQVADVVFPVAGGVYSACGVQGVNLFIGGIKSDALTLSGTVACFTDKLSATEAPETMIIGGTSAGVSNIKFDALKYNGFTDAYKFSQHSIISTFFCAGAKIGDGVLKACGFDNNSLNRGYTERFDNQTDSFTYLSTVLTARRAPAGGNVMAANTPVAMVCGGETDGNTKINTVDEINPVTLTASSGTSMTIARGYHQLTPVNHTTADVDGVVMGGADSTGAPMVSVHKHEQSTRVWSVLAPTMDVPRSMAQGDEVNGVSVVMTGGKQADNVISNLISVYTYPGSTVTHNAGSLTKARSRGHASRLTDNSIAIIGGRDSADANEATVEKINAATWTTSQLNPFPSLRHSVAVGTSQLNRCSVECKTVNVGYFKAIRNSEQYHSGIASLKIEKGHTQLVDIPTTSGSVYNITVWVRKNAAYSDSGSESTAPKINLCGCGIGAKVSCTTVTSTDWTSYNVSGTSIMDGVARLYITNASALPGAVIYVDDITKV